MNSKLMAGLTVVALVAALGAAAVWSTMSGSAQTALHEDAAVIAAGQSLYDQNCASCHGTNLEGQPDWRSPGEDGKMPAPPHDETGHTWHHPTAQLFAITKYGSEAMVGGGYRSNMGAYEDILSDAEILAVLAYIKSTWPAEIIARHTEMDAAHGG